MNIELRQEPKHIENSKMILLPSIFLLNKNVLDFCLAFRQFLFKRFDEIMNSNYKTCQMNLHKHRYVKTTLQMLDCSDLCNYMIKL